MEIRLTLHAEARMKERLGIKSKNEKQRMAELAYARGKFIEIQERERLGRLSKAIILEYKERLFVFSRSRALITVLPCSKKQYQTKAGLMMALMVKEARNAIACA